MKKLFLAFALIGIVGAVSVNTVSAMTHAKVIVGGGEECKHKKGEKCSKEKGCCKSGTASTDAKCSSASGEKKCCHAKDAKTTSSTENSDTKKTETVK